MKSRKQSDPLERLLESARCASLPATNLPPDFDRHLEAHRLAMADCSSSWMFSVCQCSLIVSLAVAFLCLAFNPILPILDGMDREIGQIQIQTVGQINEVIRRNFAEMGDHLSSAQKAKLQSYIANRNRRIEEGCSMAHPNGELRDGAGWTK